MMASDINMHGDTSDCKLHNTYTVQYGILAAVAFAVGVIMCFFGYRLFKLVLFLTGFLLAFCATYLVCEMHLGEFLDGNAHKYREQVYLGISLAAGLIAGLLTLCLFYLGLFALGATMGWFVGMAFLPLLVEHSTYIAENNWVAYLILAGFALVGGILIICLQKIIIVLATSFIGSFLLVNGLDYYIENNTTLFYSIHVLKGEVKENMLPTCWYTWTLFAFIPVMFVIGMSLQFAKTSKGSDHKRGYPGQRTVLIAAYPSDVVTETQLQDLSGDQVPMLSNYA